MFYRKTDELTDDEMSIRTEVFVDEQGFEDEYDEIDDESHHIILYDDEGKPAGCCRIYGSEDKESGEYHVGRVALKKQYRGNGYGAQIMQKAIQWVWEMNTEKHAIKPRDNKLKIVVSSQTRVRGFYESLGFVAEGKEYLDQFCPHIKMVYTIELKE